MLYTVLRALWAIHGSTSVNTTLGRHSCRCSRLSDTVLDAVLHTCPGWLPQVFCGLCSPQQAFHCYSLLARQQHSPRVTENCQGRVQLVCRLSEYGAGGSGQLLLSLLLTLSLQVQICAAGLATKVHQRMEQQPCVSEATCLTP